ncbi:MAG: FAD-dependent oxidoreductase [Synergistota bacterium]|nr:FAD-dependent oxidoreductase [Synergistota bacterium]
MSRNAEVVIIGGGIIGASIAYFLTKAGKEVIVVERDIAAKGSSGACDGTLFIQSKPSGPKMEMAIRSVDLYADLAKQIKYEFGFVQQGGMILIETEDEYKIISRILEEQRALGAPITMISGDEARKKQPGLSHCVLAATHCPKDAHINPMKATLAFLNEAMDMGCSFLKHTSVTGIDLKNNAVSKVHTTAGTISTACVINAAGAWASEISKMVGLDTPVIPRKGEILISEQIDPYLKGIFLEARYIAIKHDPSIAEKSNDFAFQKGIGMVMEQTSEGNILLGSSREFVGFDRSTNELIVEAIAKRALHFFPALKNVSMIRSFAGLRPYTPDGLPYLGPVNGVEGFIMAAGHEGDGIALAPETGRQLAELIVNGEGESLKAYSPNRLFSKK